MITARQWLGLAWITVGVFVMGGAPARGAFHLWDINEIYSNADGSVQFIELFTSANSQQFVTGHRIVARSADGSESRVFTFPSNSGSPTRNRHLLIATEGFAALSGGVTPDFILPAGFLFIPAGTVDFVGADSLTYANLPTDGVMSLTRSGPEVNSPTNFAGQTGSVIPPPTTRTWFVKADASGANDGTSWADAFPDLQDALAAAGAGDEIWVAAGAYRPSNRTNPDVPDSATFRLMTGVGLYAGFVGTENERDPRDPAANETILAGFGVHHVVTAIETDSTAILDGFTITGGRADGKSVPDSRGGGIYIVGASPTFANCRIVNNGAGGIIDPGIGGGIFADDASHPVFRDCVIADNSARNGGGLFNGGGTVTLADCVFRANVAAKICPRGACFGGRGGGIFTASGSISLENCRFSENVAVAGAAIHNCCEGNVTAYQSTFVDNMATFGNFPLDAAGGAIRSEGRLELSRCVFRRNTTDGKGGALFLSNEAVITNCFFGENTGGAAIVNVGIGTFTNCTIVGNSGGLSTGASTCRVMNCILWANRFGDVGPFAQIFGPAVVNYSCIDGGWTGAGGTGNIDADPLFVGVDDLRLRAGSRCLDAGDNSAVSTGTITDLDGNSRLVDYGPAPDTGNGVAPIVDIGAYEFQGDCNGNGVSDEQDIAQGVSDDCDTNGIPDQCDLDCNGNQIPDRCDLAAGTSLDADDSGVPDECEPQFVHIMGGLGAEFPSGAADTFISPLGSRLQLNVLFNRFTLVASEALWLVAATPTYTGRQDPPISVAHFRNLGDGAHEVRVFPSLDPGQWLKLSLRVAGQSSSGRKTFDVWLAHHPLDINQDGIVDVRDATAFGEEFGGRASPRLVDLNGDGGVDIRDATTFGQIWRGQGDNTRAWRGSTLPPKPE